MNTRHRRLIVAALAPLGVLAAVIVSACVSAGREPVVEVSASRNATAPEREEKTYAITCSSSLVQQWLLADRRALLALDEALEKLGYSEALDPRQATYLIVVDLGFAKRPVLDTSGSEESIRFQNVAAMVGQARYSKILTERNDSSGSLLMGPNGQIIPTGGWKRMIEDSEIKDTEPAGTHDSLILRAWDVSDQGAARILAWEVVVLRTMDYRMPSAGHVSILLRHAAERLASGWQETGGDPVEAKPAEESHPSSAQAATPTA